MKNTYPKSDSEFQDKVIESVAKEGDTYSITCDGGWSLWCGKNPPFEPKAGQVARQYGGGIGFTVRGLYIDGKRFWYRTPAEQEEHHQIQMYGADAKDWLARWDRGDSCWSIELGGLGPGYEQCIQITVAEILREMIDKQFDASGWESGKTWKADVKRLEETMFKNPIIESLGLSAAQWGQAVGMAARLYLRGPRSIFTDPAVKDRLIQISKHFPKAVA